LEAGAKLSQRRIISFPSFLKLPVPEMLEMPLARFSRFVRVLRPVEASKELILILFLI
jgi:hypothetical protein